MTKKQEQIAETFFKEAENVSYGSVTLELKIHAGSCIGVTHIVTERIRHYENGEGAIDFEKNNVHIADKWN